MLHMHCVRRLSKDDKCSSSTLVMVSNHNSSGRRSHKTSHSKTNRIISSSQNSSSSRHSNSSRVSNLNSKCNSHNCSRCSSSSSSNSRCHLQLQHVQPILVSAGGAGVLGTAASLVLYIGRTHTGAKWNGNSSSACSHSQQSTL